MYYPFNDHFTIKYCSLFKKLSITNRRTKQESLERVRFNYKYMLVTLTTVMHHGKQDDIQYDIYILPCDQPKYTPLVKGVYKCHTVQAGIILHCEKHYPNLNIAIS